MSFGVSWCLVIPSCSTEVDQKPLGKSWLVTARPTAYKKDEYDYALLVEIQPAYKDYAKRTLVLRTSVNSFVHSQVERGDEVKVYYVTSEPRIALLEQEIQQFNFDRTGKLQRQILLVVIEIIGGGAYILSTFLTS